MTTEAAEAESVLDALTHTYERWPCYCGAVIAKTVPVNWHFHKCACGRLWKRYSTLTWAFWMMNDTKGRKRGKSYSFHY